MKCQCGFTHNPEEHRVSDIQKLKETTPESDAIEREPINNKFWDRCLCDGAEHRFIVPDEYTKAIELSAYQRGLKDGDQCTAKSMEIAREAGWNEAVERAAKIAEKHSVDDKCVWHCALYVVNQIRALKTEGVKK